MSKGFCKQCRHWEQDTNYSSVGEYGRCRINPPTVQLVVLGGTFMAVWPYTSEKDWCGEWEQ